MLRVAFAFVAAAVLSSCGQAAAIDPEVLCSDQPISDSSSIWVTQIGCSYEQHLENIMHHGQEVSLRGTPLHAAGSPVSALVQYKCGRYLMGKDQQGLAIIIDVTSGALRSHGSVHPGLPTSSLPTSLSLPLEY